MRQHRILLVFLVLLGIAGLSRADFGPAQKVGGDGAAEDLATTLAVAAITGGADLSVTTGDSILGVAELDLDAATAVTVGATTATSLALGRSGTDATVNSDQLIVQDGTIALPGIATATTGHGWTELSSTIYTCSVAGVRSFEVGPATSTFFGSLLVGSAGTGIIKAALSQQDDGQLRFGTQDDAFMQGELAASITDAGGADTVFSVTMGDGTFCGLHIWYSLESSDSVENGVEHGEVFVAIVDDAGGVVVTVTETGDTVQALSASHGTLTTSWSGDNTDDGTIEIEIDAVAASITPTTFQVRWGIISCSNVARIVTPTP